MVDLELLKQVIARKGIKYYVIAKELGISRHAFYTRMIGKTEFLASEIVKLTEILQLTREERDLIFFTKKVE